MNRKSIKWILICVIVLIVLIAILFSLLVGLSDRDDVPEKESKNETKTSLIEKVLKVYEDKTEEKQSEESQVSVGFDEENMREDIDYSNVTYFTYKNQRFGYTLSYPGFLIPQPESTNGDGRHFVSEDGEVSLMVWGTWLPVSLDTNPTIDELYEEELSYLDYIPTYKAKNENNFVFSGYRGNKIVYQRHFLKSDGSQNVFVIEYPTALKEEFDSIVTYISNNMSLGIGTDSVCEK